MNVLAVGCHPDDIEISCCGTLAKCVKRGEDNKDQGKIDILIHLISPFHVYFVPFF